MQRYWFFTNVELIRKALLWPKHMLVFEYITLYWACCTQEKAMAKAFKVTIAYKSLHGLSNEFFFYSYNFHRSIYKARWQYIKLAKQAKHIKQHWLLFVSWSALWTLLPCIRVNGCLHVKATKPHIGFSLGYKNCNSATHLSIHSNKSSTHCAFNNHD